MSRTGGWRRLAAALATFVVAFAGLTVAGVAVPSTATATATATARATAKAIPFPGGSDCKDAPTPEVPGRGVEAFFEPAPATPPAASDPFQQGATTSIHEQYGYAGLRWNTYDLGCTGSPEASVGTTVANWLFTVPKAVVAATGALLGAAFQPDFLKVFDPLIRSVVDALRRSVFDQWAGLVLAALGFLIVWRARKASLRGTASAIGWALLVMVIATVLVRWPLAAGQAADATVTTTMSAVTSALDEQDATGRTSTGTTAANNLHDALLYQVWLGGEFGDANSVVARTYGAKLFDAQALTWAEAATLAQDPAAGAAIIEKKKAQWQEVAAHVKADDPDAYEYLVGRRTDARIGFAALSLFAVACAVPFLLTAALLIVGALIITRFAVMLFPAIATLGLFPTMRNLVVGVGNTVAAAIINAIVFGLGSAVMVKAFGVIMAPGAGLPAWLVVALVLLLTLVMWVALRPFHRLTAMASTRRNGFADAAGALGTVTRGLGRVGGRIAGTAAGVVVGEGAARRDGKDRTDADGQDGPRAEADRRTGWDGEGATPRGELAGGGGELTGPASGAEGRAGRGRPVLGSGGGSSSGSSGSGAPGASGTSSSAGGSSGSGWGVGRFLPGRRSGGEPAEAGGELVAADVGLPAATRRPQAPTRPAGDPTGAGAPGAGRRSPAGSTSSGGGRAGVPPEATDAGAAPSTAVARSRPGAPRPVTPRRPADRPVPRRSEGMDDVDLTDGTDLTGADAADIAGGATAGRGSRPGGNDDAYAVYRPRDRGRGD